MDIIIDFIMNNDPITVMGVFFLSIIVIAWGIIN